MTIKVNMKQDGLVKQGALSEINSRGFNFKNIKRVILFYYILYYVIQHHVTGYISTDASFYLLI